MNGAPAEGSGEASTSFLGRGHDDRAASSAGESRAASRVRHGRRARLDRSERLRRL